jgi:hypothetical protein
MLTKHTAVIAAIPQVNSCNVNISILLAAYRAHHSGRLSNYKSPTKEDISS